VTARRIRLTWRLGIAGSLLGVVAGLTQATVGSRIPEWTGAKQAPLELGLLTVALSLLAGLAAFRQRRADLPAGVRAACAFGLIGPGLLCLSTVGRLWYLPAVLMLTAGALTVQSWRRTASVLAANWSRVLLSALGACMLLLSAASPPALLVLGGVSGMVLIAAAWIRFTHRPVLWGLVALGTVPFAAFSWTAVVPLLVLVEAWVIAAVLSLHPTATVRLSAPRVPRGPARPPRAGAAGLGGRT
jgi:hypothetical protein